MKNQYLETGKIVNTHGVRGEVKIIPWANVPEDLLDYGTLYIDGKPIEVISARVHKGAVIASLHGVDTFEKAEALKEKIVCIDRADVELSEGEYFISDVIGLDAVDFETREKIGTVKDFYEYPSGIIYVIRGEREILVPGVSEFVREVDIDSGVVKIKLIEGM